MTCKCGHAMPQMIEGTVNWECPNCKQSYLLKAPFAGEVCVYSDTKTTVLTVDREARMMAYAACAIATAPTMLTADGLAWVGVVLVAYSSVMAFRNIWCLWHDK